MRKVLTVDVVERLCGGGVWCGGWWWLVVVVVQQSSAKASELCWEINCDYKSCGLAVVRLTNLY